MNKNVVVFLHNYIANYPDSNNMPLFPGDFLQHNIKFDMEMRTGNEA